MDEIRHDIPMMECKTWSATIPEKTCFLRYGEVKYYSGKVHPKFSSCKTCETGKLNYEKHFNAQKSILKKPKRAEKICSKCKKTMGASMFGNSGKNDVCIECEGSKEKLNKPLHTKICSKCKQEKLITDFYNNAKSNDGKSYWCKDCQNASIKKSKNDRSAIKSDNILPVIKNADMKFCNKCKTDKSVDDFYKNRSKPDGLGDQCKVCHKQSMKAYKTANDTKNKDERSKSNKASMNAFENMDKSNKSDVIDEFKLVIDFSNNKDLLEKLKKKALSEFRTMEMQLLYECNGYD